jgi:hypothetical protein
MPSSVLTQSLRPGRTQTQDSNNKCYYLPSATFVQNSPGEQFGCLNVIAQRANPRRGHLPKNVSRLLRQLPSLPSVHRTKLEQDAVGGAQ